MLFVIFLSIRQAQCLNFNERSTSLGTLEQFGNTVYAFQKV